MIVSKRGLVWSSFRKFSFFIGKLFFLVFLNQFCLRLEPMLFPSSDGFLIIHPLYPQLLILNHLKMVVLMINTLIQSLVVTIFIYLFCCFKNKARFVKKTSFELYTYFSITLFNFYHILLFSNAKILFLNSPSFFFSKNLTPFYYFDLFSSTPFVTLLIPPLR
jgi:hypothetical protein